MEDFNLIKKKFRKSKNYELSFSILPFFNTLTLKINKKSFSCERNMSKITTNSKI